MPLPRRRPRYTDGLVLGVAKSSVARDDCIQCTLSGALLERLLRDGRLNAEDIVCLDHASVLILRRLIIASCRNSHAAEGSEEVP